MSAKVKHIEEKKMISIEAGMLDDVVKDFKIIHGSIEALLGIFDAPADDYWGQVGRLDTIEVVLKEKEGRLQESIKELCLLAGRPLYPENATRADNA